jgi:adenylate cyclase, class 2
MLEQEVKLQFPTLDAARVAVSAAGGCLVVPRRLIDDQLFDTPDGRLGRAGTALRLRRDRHAAMLTVKGPVLPGPVKIREEIETSIGDARIAEAMLAILGFQPYFRSQKYREEYAIGTAHLTVDEAPVGVFVEVEGTPDEIARLTALLGRTRADYRLESYMGLWRQRCHDRGITEPADMLFDTSVTE